MIGLLMRNGAAHLLTPFFALVKRPRLLGVAALGLVLLYGYARINYLKAERNNSHTEQKLVEANELQRALDGLRNLETERRQRTESNRVAMEMIRRDLDSTLDLPIPRTIVHLLRPNITGTANTDTAAPARPATGGQPPGSSTDVP